MVGLGAVSNAGAATTWRGDFETGNLNQWDYVMYAPGIALRTSPVAGGKHSASFSVELGSCDAADKDSSGACKRYHTQVAKSTMESPGTESWWGWSLLWPTGFKADTSIFNKYGDWHPRSGSIPCQTNVSLGIKKGSSGPSYPLELYVRGGPSCENSTGQIVPIGEITPGQWMRFVWHIRWSQGASGLVELWVDGTRRASVSGPNMYQYLPTGRYDVFLKQGIYTGKSSTGQTVYVDEILRGGSRSDVELPIDAPPPPSDPAPEPAPAPAFSVETISPSDGQSVRGRIKWQAATAGAEVDRVRFLVDGSVRYIDATAPFVYGDGALWDTRLESNGQHVLTVEAVATDGRKATSNVTVRVANTKLEKRILRSFARVTEGECSACRVQIVDRGISAAASGQSYHAAYGLHDFGGPAGWPGRVWTRDMIRLPRGYAGGHEVSVFQVRDVNDRIVYEILVDAGRSIVFRSPAGGVASKRIEASTGVTLPVGGRARRVEVSAEADDSVFVRVDGIQRVQVLGLEGAETGHQRFVRVGILSNGAVTARETLARHDAVGVSAVAWLRKRGLLKPTVRFPARPKVDNRGRLRLRVHSVPRARIRLVVRGRQGKILGTEKVRLGSAGKRRTEMRLSHYGKRSLRINVRGRLVVYGGSRHVRKTKVLRLLPSERSRLRRI